jgi:hypothetical protein
MYKHMFMFNWAANEGEEATAVKVDVIRKALESQVDKIPGVLSVDRIGVNSTSGPDMKDVFVEMTFADLPSLLMYHRSDAHHAVRDIVDPLTSKEFASVDFEVTD